MVWYCVVNHGFIYDYEEATAQGGAREMCGKHGDDMLACMQIVIGGDKSFCSIADKPYINKQG